MVVMIEYKAAFVFPLEDLNNLYKCVKLFQENHAQEF